MSCRLRSFVILANVQTVWFFMVIDFYMHCLCVLCCLAKNINVCGLLHLRPLREDVIRISCVYFRAARLYLAQLFGYHPWIFLSLHQHIFLLFVIDYDPQVIEQKEQSRPACLPLSYVLRFITDAARKEGPFLGTSGAELKRKLAIKHHSYSMTSSNRSLSPTGKDAWAYAQYWCVVSHLKHVLTPIHIVAFAQIWEVKWTKMRCWCPSLRTATTPGQPKSLVPSS